MYPGLNIARCSAASAQPCADLRRRCLRGQRNSMRGVAGRTQRRGHDHQASRRARLDAARPFVVRGPDDSVRSRAHSPARWPAPGGCSRIASRRNLRTGPAWRRTHLYEVCRRRPVVAGMLLGALTATLGFAGHACETRARRVVVSWRAAFAPANPHPSGLHVGRPRPRRDDDHRIGPRPSPSPCPDTSPTPSIYTSCVLGSAATSPGRSPPRRS